MRVLTLAMLALLGCAVSVPAAADDGRTVIRLPAETRSGFLDEMRGHMDALDDVISALAAKEFARASHVARTELGIGSGKGFGRFMPPEFREMGMAMHRSALDFADAAAATPPVPAAQDWARAMMALQSVSTACRACHSAFRIE